MPRKNMKKVAEELKKELAEWDDKQAVGSGWVCDYWKSIYDDLKETHDTWRGYYDRDGCTVPHSPGCTYINSQIIEATQNMNLTKQYAAEDGCDTSDW